MLTILTFLLVVLVNGRAEAEPAAAVRKLIDEQRQQLHIAGVAYAVVIDDKVIAMEGLGELVPFAWTTQDALGDKTAKVQTVKWNVTLPASTFARPAKLTR